MPRKSDIALALHSWAMLFRQEVGGEQERAALYVPCAYSHRRGNYGVSARRRFVW